MVSENSSDYLTIALQLVDRIFVNGTQALFMLKGKPKMVGIESAKYKRLCIQSSHALVGVYDGKATPERIMEDMACLLVQGTK